MGVETLTFKRSLPGTQVPVVDVAEPEAAVKHGAPGSTAVHRALQIGLPLVLAGYALFDRGFAYLASVPGTPVFAGELILLLGAGFAVLATGHFKLALRHSLPTGVLAVFAAWGLVRTVPLIPVYGLDAIRDAALWYYALIAILVRALVVARPDLPGRWARAYAPFVVVLLLWSPVALLLANVASPTVPGSDVPAFAHKIGNIAVDATIAIAFLWLVPTPSLSRRVRALLTALASVIVVASETQNRGGAVAALVAILLIGVLAGHRRRSLAGVVLGTMVVGLVLAWGLDIHVSGGTEGRDISVAQLWQNVASISGGAQDNSQLNATVAFRDTLWSGAINMVQDQNTLMTGVGFGPNLAQELGVPQLPGEPLRSPHNSHVDVLARMGLIGGVLWLVLWVSWYVVVLNRLRHRSAPLSPLSEGILKVCVVGVTAILANAYFDPTLESPQVAIWLWTLVGLGLGIASLRTRSRVTGRRIWPDSTEPR
jgi:O-Antigen ligase